MSVHNLKTIATVVRNQCVRFAMSPFARKYDFYKREDLQCMCAIASMTLKKVAEKFNIDVKLAMGPVLDDENRFLSMHCWNIYQNTIYDITATQFGYYEPVYIKNAINTREYCIEQFIEDIYQFSDWPPEQRPNKRVLNILVYRSLKKLEGDKYNVK